MWTIKDFEIISKKNEGGLILNCGISDINININEKNMPNNAMFLSNTRFPIKKSLPLRRIKPKNMSRNKGLNRIKVVLAEKQCTNKWLAEQLDKGEATISKWCTNRAQPSLETLVEIANVLQVDVKDLLQSTVQESDVVYIKIPKSTL